MSTEIAKIQSMPIATMGELFTVGQLLAQTQLFGTSNPAEGFVIAAMCQQEGLSYMGYMQTYHMIKGKVSKRADKIQADFMKMGGEVVIKQRDENGTIIDLSYKKSKYTSTCIWEEIKGEPFVSTKDKNGQLVFKEKYATPRSRKQMMWARAISDGVRTVCPEAVAGLYTPEETEDFAGHAEAGHAEAGKTITAEDVAKRVDNMAGMKTAEATASQPVYTQPVVQPQQSAQAPQAMTMQPMQQTEPTPFDLMKPSAAPQDFNACPIEGPMFRVRWDSMTDEVLAQAVHLQIAKEYIDVIKAVVQSRTPPTSN